MNLKNYHKSQFKYSLYKLISQPGILNEMDCVEVMQEVIEEITEGEC